MDLRKHRLSDWNWYNNYRDQYGQEAFEMFKKKVLALLLNLKPGYYYDLAEAYQNGEEIFNILYTVDGMQKSERNIDLFIKVCCMYILSFQEYVFTDDFNQIIRR